MSGKFRVPSLVRANHAARGSAGPVNGRRIVEYCVYVVVRLLIALVQALSLTACAQAARVLAWVFCDVLHLRQQVINDNLHLAYPRMSPDERRRLARRMWEHLFLLVAEVAHARRKIHTTNWHHHVCLCRVDRFARLLLDERPTILVSGHFGNFEVSAYVLGLFGFSTYAVARPLDNPYLDRFITSFRAGTGQYMLSKNDCAEQLATLLEQGATLGLLGDQYATGKKNCWVDFYGRPASTHKAIALLSLMHDAPLAVSYCQRVDGPLRFKGGLLDVADPADPNFDLRSVPALTQWYTKQLERMINRAPEQYWWLHKRWKGTPPLRLRRKQAA